MTTNILPRQRIGIIGGGLAAKLLTLQAKQMGYYVGVLTNIPDDPTAKVADWLIESQVNDLDGLLELAEKSDVLTFVTEEIDLDVLTKLKRYIQLPQLSDSLSVIQDRLIEKVFLESQNINVTPYATITTLSDITEAVLSIGYPCVLKPIRVEVEQPANVFLNSEEDFHKAEKVLETGSCILESWIPFEKELAVTLAIDSEGEMTTFPIVETHYVNGVLANTQTPAKIDDDMQEAILDMSRTIASGMNMTGLLTIELFVTSVGTFYVKRLSATPRMLANYTLDTNHLSQYEALIRIICGLPLPEIDMHQVSITHYLDQKQMEEAVAEMMDHPEWHVRFYDRDDSAKSHFKGQLTVFNPEPEEEFNETS